MTTDGVRLEFGEPPPLLPQRAALPRGEHPHRRGARAPLREPPGARRCGTSTTSTAVTSPSATARSRPSTSGVGSPTAMDDRRHEPRLGNGLLGTALRRLRTDRAAAPDARVGQSHPGARLAPLHVGRTARVLRGPAARARRADARDPDHDELHARRSSPCDYWRWASREDVVTLDSLPRSRRPEAHVLGGARLRPHAFARRAAALAPARARPGRRQLARGERHQAARRSCGSGRSRRSPAARTA